MSVPPKTSVRPPGVSNHPSGRENLDKTLFIFLIIYIRYGWSYYHIRRYAKGRFTKKRSTHRTVTSRSNYLYRSPCGRSFLTLDEIEKYLLETNSKLTIKFFIDDRSTHLESSIKYNSKYILNEDIAQGNEYVKISVYNENNLNLPESFIYGTETRSKLIIPSDTTTMTCCSCTDK